MKRIELDLEELLMYGACECDERNIPPELRPFVLMGMIVSRFFPNRPEVYRGIFGKTVEEAEADIAALDDVSRKRFEHMSGVSTEELLSTTHMFKAKLRSV